MADTKAKAAEAAVLEAGPAGATDLLEAFREGGRLHVSEPKTNPDGSITYFVGKELIPITAQPIDKPLPAYVQQREVVVEPASFIDYVVNYKSSTAICRASLGGLKIEAILDYHGRAREGDRETATPGHLTHTVTLQCPYDGDYLKWRTVFGKGLDQRELAEFIEDMVYTIGDPPAADLLEAISDLKIDRSVRFKSFRNERNGNVSLAYEEVDNEKEQGSVTLPEQLLIVVPIFQGGNPQAIPVRLRFRMEKGSVEFRLSVPGLGKIEGDAFRSIGEGIRQATNTSVYYTA